MGIAEYQAEYKKQIITSLIDREGGYVDNKKDSGGKTRWGITEKLARAYGYTGEMADLPYDTAFTIYDLEFWRRLRCDDLVILNYYLAVQLFDFAVISSVYRAAVSLQRALNVLNYHEKYYEDLKLDGSIGPRTLKAIHSYFKHRDSAVLNRAVMIFKGSHFLTLAEQRKKDEEFIYGWLKNRIDL